MENQNEKGRFLLGVDTGTSKTHAMIADSSGNVIGFGESGPGNYEVVGEEGLKIALQEATNQALKMAKQDVNAIVSMGFGFSGYDWPSEQEVMIRAIESLHIPCSYQFENDATIGLIAGTSDGWGIAVDAGTGNNVRGRDKSGKIGRITGNSIYCGEVGGGGELVWLATVAATYAWTQRGPKTKITQCLIDFCEVENEDKLIEGLATNKLHLPPKLAESIIKLAVEGDPTAREIVTFSATELAKNVNAVIRQLNMESLKFEVVLIGSIFKSGAIYMEPFLETLYSFAPGAAIVHLSVPPVVGAVLLAAEQLGIKGDQFRSKLIKSTEQLLAGVISTDL